MSSIHAIPAGAADLLGVGEVFGLSADAAPDVVASEGPGWRDRYTARSVIAGPTHVGLTVGPGVDTPVTHMERHLYTREAVLPLTEAVVLPVAPSPDAATIQALIVEPGQVLVLEIGVWHAPAMGLSGPTQYYWLAGVDESVDSQWVPIAGGPVTVRLPELWAP